jgi:large subunit ribosomal protein L24
MGNWIKKGDKVVVLSGNDKGRIGSVLHKKGDRAVVQGVNIRKRHAKRQGPAQTPTILEVEKPVHISNISLCDEQGKPVKIQVRASAKKGKELIYLSEGKEVVLRTLAKGR